MAGRTGKPKRAIITMAKLRPTDDEVESILACSDDSVTITNPKHWEEQTLPFDK
ncbi:hypothetical protein KIPB_015488, partial [Kipferlia bialata]|eukprot:g15488.t1